MIYELQRETEQKGVWEIVNTYTDVEMAIVEQDRLEKEDPHLNLRVVGSDGGTGLRRAREC